MLVINDTILRLYLELEGLDSALRSFGRFETFTSPLARSEKCLGCVEGWKQRARKQGTEREKRKEKAWMRISEEPSSTSRSHFLLLTITSRQVVLDQCTKDRNHSKNKVANICISNFMTKNPRSIKLIGE